MPTRCTLLIAAACCFLMSWGILITPAAAGDAAATAFVTKIYDAYKGKDAKGVDYSAEAVIRRLFEPTLAALIIKDDKAAARRKEVPTLDGSPFVDAQEWEIFVFDIAVTDAPPDKAVATIGFKNFDEQKTIVLNLVKIKNDWRIADIISQRDGRNESLRALFKH
jgi:Protein of unknown function (DUF3828)